MATPASKSKTVIRRTTHKSKPVSMAKVEMFQKMIADQKFMREAIQNGVGIKELREKYGYKFATV